MTRIPTLTAVLLRELPGLLGADQPPEVRARLFPDASEDETIAEEWRRTQHPELFALLADAKGIVEADLAALWAQDGEETWSMRIPGDHVTAWVSALNAARLALAARFDLAKPDRELDMRTISDERGLAALEMDQFAWFQARLIGALGYRA